MPPASINMALVIGSPMQPTSHIVKVDASSEFHSLSEAISGRLPHIRTMDKNGGSNNLKAWREFRKLSQEDLAEAVGTSTSQISMLETGDRGLTAKWLRRLAPALNTTPGHLLDHDPTELPTDIVEIWLNADAKQRRQLVEVAQALVRNNGTEG